MLSVKHKMSFMEINIPEISKKLNLVYAKLILKLRQDGSILRAPGETHYITISSFYVWLLYEKRSVRKWKRRCAFQFFCWWCIWYRYTQIHHLQVFRVSFPCRFPPFPRMRAAGRYPRIIFGPEGDNIKNAPRVLLIHYLCHEWWWPGK